MAFILQPLDSPQDLYDLIGLGLALGTLNIDSRVSLPRGLVDPMAGSLLTRLPEVVLADATCIREAYPLRVLPHLLDCFFNLSHNVIVSLLIFLSSANLVVWHLSTDLKKKKAKPWIQGIVLFTNPEALLSISGETSVHLFQSSDILDYIVNFNTKRSQPVIIEKLKFELMKLKNTSVFIPVLL
jgi:hypothetical protein